MRPYRASIYFAAWLACCFGTYAHAGNEAPRAQEVAFSNNGVILSGTLLSPTNPAPHPGMVLMPGSGNETRDALMNVGQAFAAEGMVILVYDKRGSGKSQGDWVTSSLDDLAGDAAAAIRFLRTQAGVDPKSVGAWGISQSGWVLPRLARQMPDLPFVICVTGGGGTPRETEYYGYDNELKHAGFSEADRHAARALVERYMDYLSTGLDRKGLLDEIRKSKAEPWSSVVNLERVMPDETDRIKWAWVADYDPLQDSAAMKMPVLVMLGGRDPFTPVEDALLGWHRALAEAGNPYDLIIEYPVAGHGIRTNGHDMQAAPVYAPGYLQDQVIWLSRLGLLHNADASRAPL